MVWAAAQLRHYAPALYYAPHLWGTSDGVIAYRRFWAEYVVMATHLAQQRLLVANAVSLAMSGEDGESARAEARAWAAPDFRGV